MGPAFDEILFQKLQQNDKIPLYVFADYMRLRTDVFLTHDWGNEEKINHLKVSKINSQLKELGLKTWFDEEKMEGNIRRQMADGIDHANIVIVFITQRYIKKVSGDNANDNCQLEFNYAVNHKSGNRMIAVVMEPSMRDTKFWQHVGMVLGANLYIDMADLSDDIIKSDEATEQSKQYLCDKCEELKAAVLKKVGKSVEQFMKEENELLKAVMAAPTPATISQKSVTTPRSELFRPAEAAVSTRKNNDGILPALINSVRIVGSSKQSASDTNQVINQGIAAVPMLPIDGAVTSTDDQYLLRMAQWFEEKVEVRQNKALKWAETVLTELEVTSIEKMATRCNTIKKVRKMLGVSKEDAEDIFNALQADGKFSVSAPEVTTAPPVNDQKGCDVDDDSDDDSDFGSKAQKKAKARAFLSLEAELEEENDEEVDLSENEKVNMGNLQQQHSKSRAKSMPIILSSEELAALFHQCRENADNDAFRTLTTAARHGYLEAKCAVGKCLLDGYGTTKDEELARECFELAVEEDHAESKCMLGLCLMNGQGVQNKDASQAAKWFKKAAKQGYPQGMYLFATCLLQGKGLGANVDKGMKWLKRAADGGDYGPAQYEFAMIYYDGKYKMKTSKHEAKKWLDKAAAHGYQPAIDMIESDPNLQRNGVLGMFMK